MKGLMRKELSLLTRGVGLLFAIASILFAVSAGVSTDASVMNSMAFLYVHVGTWSVMSIEEKWKWDKMLLCTPVGRYRMVGAKYLVVGLQLLLNLAIFAVANLLTAGGQGLALGVQQCGLGFGLGALMMTLPFWLGVEKSKGTTIVSMILFCLALGGNSAFLKHLESVFQVSWTMAGATMVGGLILYGLSIPLAGWLYGRRK